jgi:hypothetical protein
VNHGEILARPAVGLDDEPPEAGHRDPHPLLRRRIGQVDVAARHLRERRGRLLHRLDPAQACLVDGLGGQPPVVDPDLRFLCGSGAGGRRGEHPAADQNRDLGHVDAFLEQQNQPVVVAAPGVLGNDTDPDGDPLTASLVSAPGHGSVQLATDGSFT